MPCFYCSDVEGAMPPSRHGETQIHPPQTCKRSVEDDACIVPHTEPQPWYTVINILSPRRAPLFSTRNSSVCGKLFRFFSLFPCHYAVCIPVFAHKLPLFTQSLPEFPAISCLVHPQFIFILHDRIYRGPPITAPTLEELLCTKPNSRATPKRRPALYMP